MLGIPLPLSQFQPYCIAAFMAIAVFYLLISQLYLDIQQLYLLDCVGLYLWAYI